MEDGKINIKINENRKVYCFNNVGTQNENQVTELRILVPEKYQDFNKKVVFVTDDGAIWDIIEDNSYKLTKAITKYKRVKFYIWLTKNEEDFRSEEKTLIFNDNIEVTSEIEVEEINGINKLINIVEAELTKITKEEENLNNLIKDIQYKLDNGEFKGEKGDSGIVGFEIREGNLIATSENLENIDKFKIKDGNMILTI